VKVTCPLCNQKLAEELCDEVDIGVGVQKHVFGYECEACGQIGICSECGIPDGLPHASFCRSKPPPTPPATERQTK
jgi:hypothetical protein